MNIPGFKILEQLGEGPMSTVWKAHQESLNRVVAIKVLKHKFPIKPNEVHPVLKEARAAAALKHPNIIPVFDAGETDGAFYFVMEFVAGSTVAQLIESKGFISQGSSLNAAIVIIDALDHACKTANIVHRGINPDNIMIDGDGVVKIADLGLAKIADPNYLSARMRDNTVQGKLNYVSPEQAKCSIRIDFHTDMYGLGATLYHMVTGRRPFDGLEPREVLNQQLTGFIENPRDVQPEVSAGMAHMIKRLMMKDYRERYADWTEVLLEIQTITTKKHRKGAKKSPAKAEPVAEGVSTVAAAKKPEAPPKKVRHFSLSSSGEKKNRELITEPPEPSTPWYIQLPAWTFMLVLWGCIGVSQLKLPSLVEPPPRPVAKPATVVETETTQALVPVVQPQVAVAPKPELTIESAEEADKRNLEAFKETVAGRLRVGDTGGALDMIQQEMDYEHSKEFVTDMTQVRELIIGSSKVLNAGLRKRVGQQIVIKERGTTRRGTIRSVTDTAVSVEFTEKVGTSKVTTGSEVPIAKLDTEELIKAIGSGTTPADNLAKFCIYSKKGALPEARDAAANCGILSGPLKKALGPES